MFIIEFLCLTLLFESGYRPWQNHRTDLHTKTGEVKRKLLWSNKWRSRCCFSPFLLLSAREFIEWVSRSGELDCCGKRRSIFAVCALHTVSFHDQNVRFILTRIGRARDAVNGSQFHTQHKRIPTGAQLETFKPGTTEQLPFTYGGSNSLSLISVVLISLNGTIPLTPLWHFPVWHKGNVGMILIMCQWSSFHT